ncbi:hydroxycarboxylic acid receptor 2-like [Paramacrobiotus metropolitanus]|uniref:hydroxycarboxylic acid receptor 2-like n=1 Tax=Paramacrobiotus metropolitanus TaxID=2943436 RepID=UPI002446283B|nr:hydroxycarboxylic acid receptor 2-like [Paramacrobiotus metropolitanus]
MALANNSSVVPFGPVIAYPELLAWFIISTIICVIGTIAGVALMSVILKQHNFRDGTNPLIVQWLGLDCFILAIPTLLANIEVFRTQIGHPGAINCKPVFFLQYFPTCVSHWIQVCIALNRCTAVLFPHHFRTCSSRASVGTMSGFCWLLNIGLSVPFLFGVGATFAQAFPLGSCSLLINNPRVFLIMGSLVTTVPLCLEGLCYAVVLVGFRCQRQVQPGNSRSDAHRQKRKRKENMISLVLLLCFLWYLVCYLPQTVISSYMGWYWRTHWSAFNWLRTLFGTAQAGTPVSTK